MVPGRYLSAIARAVSRRAWCAARQLAGGGDFRRIAELFSVIWMSSVAMTALSQTRSASISLVSLSCIQERSPVVDIKYEGTDMPRPFLRSPMDECFSRACIFPVYPLSHTRDGQL